MHETGMQPAIPVGLGMALVHNQQALTKFSALTYEEKRAFIAGVHGIDSRQECAHMSTGSRKAEKCPRCEKRSGGIFMSRSG